MGMAPIEFCVPEEIEQALEKEWGQELGYKVHFSESCEEETPHLITQGLTTAATPRITPRSGRFMRR